MTDRLRGKRALITAAGQGIGRATAELFIAEGAEVLATDIDADLLAGLDCDRLAMDVRDDGAVRRGVDRVRPDVLFNCAGVVHHGTVLDATEADWTLAFDLNVASMFRTIRAALPHMLEAGGGSIVNMSSAASSVIGAPNRAIYGATKAAVIGLTKSVAADFVARGVRCNAICPGTVDSPSWRARVRALGAEMGSEEAAMAGFVSRQPMGRVGRAEEIAALAVYLASDESAFTTGHAHLIDGGWSGQ
jgi:2-keto-3-deoxy-L-fuconate dehydrogenase